MNIVTALEERLIEGFDSEHDHVIETVLSKLFVRGDRVHKAYKHRTADFADLTLRDIRRSYISEDFYWNNAMAPDIYLELRGVMLDGSQFVHVPELESEDWYIVMRKIDSTRDLMRILERESPTPLELVQYVDTLLSRLRVLSEARQQDLIHFFDKGRAHVHDEVRGASGWASATAGEILSLSDVERAERLLERALEIEPYFNQPIPTISVVIDNNGENIIFLERGVSFIDVMPPKDSWRVHDRYFLVCRTSADITALQGSVYAEILHDAYAMHHELPSPVVRATYEIAAALIQVPYRIMVGREDLAKKYATFIRKRCNELALLIDSKD